MFLVFEVVAGAVWLEMVFYALRWRWSCARSADFCFCSVNASLVCEVSLGRIRNRSPSPKQPKPEHNIVMLRFWRFSLRGLVHSLIRDINLGTQAFIAGLWDFAIREIDGVMHPASVPQP